MRAPGQLRFHHLAQVAMREHGRSFLVLLRRMLVKRVMLGLGLLPPLPLALLATRERGHH